ncbi:hypothetical protein GOODEAATRI_022218 [Goodea atripinnis]|uniref:Uncharacterized protein n=1 Tax=Goodea atripinnis TaxID=208336 RepID=A0ABV0NME6_9TELE
MKQTCLESHGRCSRGLFLLNHPCPGSRWVLFRVSPAADIFPVSPVLGSFRTADSDPHVFVSPCSTEQTDTGLRSSLGLSRPPCMPVPFERQEDRKRWGYWVGPITVLMVGQSEAD